MLIINIIVAALLSAAIGGRFDMPERKLPRFVWVAGFGILLLCNAPDFGWWCAWMYSFVIIRVLPTFGLITATNGWIANDARSWFGTKLYIITEKFYKLLPKRISSKVWGVIYGFIRTLLVVLAAWYLGNTALYFAPLIGVVYWLSGVICRRFWQERYAVAIAEVIIGFYIGVSL